MTKREFLDELWSALYGNVPEAEAREKIEYYENYFKEEGQKGRSDSDIIAELGDAKLIAKTIIDTSSHKEETDVSYAGSSDDSSSDNNNSYNKTYNNGNPFSGYYYMGPGCFGSTGGCLLSIIVFYFIMMIAGYLLRGALDLTFILFSSPLALIALIAFLIYQISKRR